MQPWQQQFAQPVGGQAGTRFAPPSPNAPAIIPFGPPAHSPFGPPAHAPSPFAPPGFAPPAYQQPWGAPTPAKKPPAMMIIILSVSLVLGIAVAAAVATGLNIAPWSQSGPGPVPGGNKGNRYTQGPPDTNPADPPTPTTWDQVDAYLLNNPIYDQHLPKVDCRLGTLDLSTAPTEEIEKYLNVFVDCLMYAWYGPMIDAGYELPHPSVTVYTEPINTRCGMEDMQNAFYCTGDQQIYYAQDMLTLFPQSMRALPYLVESVLAHEFGHHIQYRTGIFDSSWDYETQAQEQGQTAEAMRFNRRLELQADCLDGLFLAAVADSSGFTDEDKKNVLSMYDIAAPSTPESDDHGTATNRKNWITQGLNSDTPGVCRTYEANDEEVS